MTRDDPVAHLSRDRKMARIIRRVGPYEIKLRRNRYESLVRAIITQQLSGHAARTISARFAAMYEARFPKPADVAATPAVKLRRAGLSKMKAAYIKDVSRRIESGKLRLDRLAGMSDEDVVCELTGIRGIGRWTAEMFMMFTLGRQDVLPVGDLGLRKGVMRLHNMQQMPTETEIVKIAERWRPYRTAATWYLWRSLSFEDI